MIITVTLAPAFDLTYRLPQIHEHEINRVDSAHLEPAGKGANVSSALAQEDYSTVAIAPIPDTPLGNLWIELAEEKFDVNTSIVDREIRINTSVVDDIAVTKINEKAVELSETEISDLIEVLSLQSGATKPRWIALCGTIHPKNVDRVGKAIKEIADRHRARFAVDCSGESMMRLLDLKPDLIKPNRDELLEIYPEMGSSMESYLDHVKKLAARIDGTVLCTDGSKTAYATDGATVVEMKPPQLTGVNSIGAGDASLAGFLAATEDDKDFVECVKQSMLWGTAACLQDGSSGLNLDAAEEVPAHVEQIA